MMEVGYGASKLKGLAEYTNEKAATIATVVIHEDCILGHSLARGGNQTLAISIYFEAGTNSR